MKSGTISSYMWNFVYINSSSSCKNNDRDDKNTYHMNNGYTNNDNNNNDIHVHNIDINN